ncbi:uncharacterized protein LOC119275895 [Triticum dicoccoides]|uniref:uncharacterized protein LOC119275895 n=1 Tax=Triticum dicoccoides TaxID=85692 RepID=UPI00188FAEF0|nr:uncharacterized protein LOC119275895 [Triticum dicoccoides]
MLLYLRARLCPTTIAVDEARQPLAWAPSLPPACSDADPDNPATLPSGSGKDAGFHTMPEKCHFPNLVSVRARSRCCPSVLGAPGEVRHLTCEQSIYRLLCKHSITSHSVRSTEFVLLKKRKMEFEAAAGGWWCGCRRRNAGANSSIRR